MTDKNSKKKNLEHLKAYQFKPGQSGNPRGVGCVPKELRDSRKHNQIKVAEILNDFANMNDEEFEKAIGPGAPQLEQMIGGAIKKAKQGEFTALNFILDRMIGKVTERVEHKMPKPTVIKFRGGNTEVEAIVLGHDGSKEEEPTE